jgi:outer membrane protein insertion porin family
MRRNRLYLRRAIIAAFSLLINLMFLPVLAMGQENIVKIEIEGNKRIETNIIKNNLSSKEGEPLSRETVREDIRNIYKLGFFEDVSAEVEETPEGVVLIYRVREKPVVVDLRIRGNKEIKNEAIMDVIDVKEGRIIELNKVKKSVEAIEKLYSEKGYVARKVTYNIEPKGEGTVSVTFDIQEGKRAFIKKVNFVGNEALKTKQLKEGLYTKTKGMFSFITKSGLYNPEEIDNDTQRIRAKYYNHGYLDVKVSKPEVEFSEEEKGYIVTFRIEEGKQYKIKNITFNGDLIVPREQLLSLLKLKSGEIFRGEQLADDIEKLTTFYGDKGYAFANVDPGVKQNREELTVDLNFLIEKGTEVYIRDIDIVGNTRTKDKVIRREIPIEEEQLYNTSKVDAIKPRVSRLGFFEENVEVATDRVPGTENQVDLSVKVKEKPTGFFSVAGGFSSVETIIFAGQIQESNIFGTGKRVSLNAQIGGVTQLFFLDYTDPHFLDSDWSLDAIGFRSKQVFRDFDRTAWGGSLTVGRRLFSHLSGSLTYRLESLKISNVDRNASFLITENSQTVSSFSYGLVWDTLNNVLDPTRGNISRTNIEYAGPFGGDTDFVRYNVSSRQFVPFWYNTYFSVFGTYGIIDFQNVGNQLVVAERYFLGGPNTLRGFGFRRVSPRVPVPDGGYVLIGGVQQLLFQVDYIFPLLSQVGLKGVVFFDMGNVFNDGQNVSINPSNLRKDWGLGFRWNSPLGPLRLEVGFPIGTRLPGEKSYEVQFTVGTLF